MAKQPALSNLSSGFRSSNKLNENFAEIRAAFLNTLSRDGSTPNFMQSHLDMNSKRIVNLGAPSASQDAVRLIDLQNAALGSIVAIAPEVIWVHNYDEGDGDGAMWRRAIAVAVAESKNIMGLAGTYELDGTPDIAQGLIGLEGTGYFGIIGANGNIVFTAPASTNRAIFSLRGGGRAFVDKVVFDATNVTSNFAVKIDGGGDFSFGTMGVIYKGFRMVGGTNGSVNGIELNATDVQGHSFSGGSQTGSTYGYSDGGYIDRIISTNATGCDLNISATKFPNFRVGQVIGRWTKWETDGIAYPTRYACVRLGNGVSNVTVGFAFAEGKYRGVRLTDTDNCWVDSLVFKDLLGPAVLCNRKDQRARASGVREVSGVGPCRGNKRNDLGVSDKDNELVLGEVDVAIGVQEGEGWTVGRVTISADVNAPGSGVITTVSGNATVTNKDEDYVGQDFNCFDDVEVGDLLFTTAGVVLGKVLSKGAKTYWTDPAGTISTLNPALADHATQPLTLTGGATATVTGVAYEQRTPDAYFYVENVGNVTISGTAITNLGVATVAASTITTTTSSATVDCSTSAITDADIGKSIFTSGNVFVGQIASTDDDDPTVFYLTQNAAVALTGQAFKLGYGFTTQFEAGDLIFNKTGAYIGVVQSVTDDLNAVLTATAITTVTNDTYMYGKLYKVGRGLEVQDTATDSNINLNDVLVLGATDQHYIDQPTGIKGYHRDTIQKSQLATLDPTERRGENWQMTNGNGSGPFFSDGDEWARHGPTRTRRLTNTTAFALDYQDHQPNIQLHGAVAAGTTEVLTLPTTDVPDGATFLISCTEAVLGTWDVTSGSSLVRLRGGQWAIVSVDKSSGSVVWRLLAAGTATNRLPKIVRGSGSPEASIIGSIGDMYLQLNAVAGQETWIKETGDGTNTGWIIRQSPRTTTFAAMSALTASSYTNQIFFVTDVGTNGTFYRSNGSAFVAMYPQFGLGTVSLPGISFATDTNTGIWSPGADTLAVSTNGAERLRVLSDGKVGIGVTTPNARLQVSGLINFEPITVSTFIGDGAGNAVDTGTVNQYNVGVGYRSLYNNTTSVRNTAVGYTALQANTTGNNNTGLGYTALAANVDGLLNVAIGSRALSTATTGSHNVAIGGLSMYNVTSPGSRNVGIGYSGLVANTGSDNVSIGYLGLATNVAGGDTVGIGAETLRYNSTASQCVAVGSNAGRGASDHTATGVVAVGYLAGYSLATGASYSTLFGYRAGSGLTTGARNTLVGPSTISTSYNQVTTGSRNISIGNDVALADATANDQLCIGNLIYGTTLSGTGTTISTSGLLGIGVKAPQGKFHILGTSGNSAATVNTGADDLIVENSATGGISILTPDTTGVANIFFGHNNDNDAGRIVYTNNGDHMSFYTNGAEVARLDSNGDLGVGVTDPTQKLHVAGAIKQSVYTVATLPAAPGAGTRAFVSDASGPTFGATVVGGGAVTVPVYHDGSNWCVG